MFKTHESVGVDFLGQHGDGYRHWRLVERDLNQVWFHLTVSFQESGKTRVKSVFPNDVAILAHLVSQADEEIDVLCVQAVLPPHVTGKNRWVMIPLTLLEVAHTKTGEPVNIFHAEDGETFSDPPLPPKLLLSLDDRKTLYFKSPLRQS
ncbi:hypothetical protein [Pseudomonas sediminis]|uniref:hypothetical protein n=1 Tax=Pseudomonas sediminis TaxID=1691904 RepID=UPI0031CC50AA